MNTFYFCSFSLSGCEMSCLSRKTIKDALSLLLFIWVREIGSPILFSASGIFKSIVCENEVNILEGNQKAASLDYFDNSQTAKKIQFLCSVPFDFPLLLSLQFLHLLIVS